MLRLVRRLRLVHMLRVVFMSRVVRLSRRSGSRQAKPSIKAECGRGDGGGEDEISTSCLGHRALPIACVPRLSRLGLRASWNGAGRQFAPVGKYAMIIKPTVWRASLKMREL
jgi:hypothetical protein